MNPTIRDFAVKSGVAPAQALADPEQYDAYRTYDNLTTFVELTKSYYMTRAVHECLAILGQSTSTAEAAQRIRETFGAKP